MRGSPENRGQQDEPFNSTEGAQSSEVRRELAAAETERREQLLVLRKVEQRRRDAPQVGSRGSGP